MNTQKLIILLLMLISATGARAAGALAVEPFLDGRQLENQEVRITNIANHAIAKFDLELYRSVTVGHPDDTTVKRIEKAVRSDGANAISREVQFRNGRLFYGFYSLPPHSNGTNRYLFYMNSGEKIIVILMRGKASAEQIKKMLKQ